MEYTNKVSGLAKNLCKSGLINSFDDKNEKESDRLAISLVDMEESFGEIKMAVQKLMLPGIWEEYVDDALVEVLEELRHIIYHVRDSMYFNGLL